MITQKELIESDEYWEEAIDNLLYNYRYQNISVKRFKKMIIELKNELINHTQQGFSEREELIKYQKWLTKETFNLGTALVGAKRLVDQYLDEKK